MGVKKQRATGPELLRIVAMILIVVSHASCIGSGIWEQQGSLRSFLLLNLYYAGSVGVAAFAMLTGYYMHSSGFRLRGICKIVMQTLFYSLICYIIYVISGGVVHGKELLKAFLPITTGQYWFVTAYVGLMLLTPFINMLLRLLSLKYVFLFSAILFVVNFICPSGIIQLMYLYVAGSGISLYQRQRVGKLWGPCRCFAVFLGLYSVCAAIVSTLYAVSLGGMPSFLVAARFFHTSSGVLPGLMGGALVMGFTRLPAFSLSCVNEIAAGALAVYLVHCSPWVQNQILYGLFGLWALPDMPVLHIILYLPFLGISLYMGVGFVDWMRRKTWGRLEDSFLDCIFFPFLARLRYKVEKIGNAVQNIDKKK